MFEILLLLVFVFLEMVIIMLVNDLFKIYLLVWFFLGEVFVISGMG